MEIKNKLLKTVLWVGGILLAIPVSLAAFFLIVVGPVDISKDNCVLVKGTAVRIFEGPSYDIVFKLKEYDRVFYINRGIEQGLSVKGLQNDLLGQQVELWYAKSWPFDGGHMTQLQRRGKILYSEWEEPSDTEELH